MLFGSYFFIDADPGLTPDPPFLFFLSKKEISKFLLTPSIGFNLLEAT